MRDKLELWKIIDEHLDRYFDTGLCNLLLKCCLHDKITSEEYHALKNELENYGDEDKYFLGTIYDPKPRKEFIKKMIDKHSK